MKQGEFLAEGGEMNQEYKTHSVCAGTYSLNAGTISVQPSEKGKEGNGRNLSFQEDPGGPTNL